MAARGFPIPFLWRSPETGGGFLTACGCLRELTVHMDPSERSALRDFVTEASGRLLVHYLLPGPDGEEHEAGQA